ncbi:MAG: alcohol dehydrogenase catalytic domain-containing protein [Chloroflexi bacterium]|nr:alcohol dehydrogenase catalytic domain-containing protein [Chloroflexota bacterium]
MRVGVYYNNNDVRVEERPVPRIGSGELLLRVQASGICGSDVMEWYRIHKAPLVLGHEIAGEIVAVGEGVDRYKEGDRVTAYHHVPCNTCHYCLNGHHTACDTFRSTHFDPGGFAEYARVKAINVERGMYPLPDDVSFEEGAFIEPLACVVRGQRLARVQAGQNVLVIGSGIAGLLHVQLARALGAARVVATDIVEYRLQAALRFGADASFHAERAEPARLHEAFGGRLPDVIVVCAGVTQAILQALRLIERGGTVLLFAPPRPGLEVPIPVGDFWADEVTITTCYGGSPADAAVAFDLIRARRILVCEMITHRLSLEEIGLGFRLVAVAQESIKVIIEPQR